MAKDFPAGLKSQLETLLGDRVRFNKVERMVYSHDMGVLPNQVMKLFNNMPDAVLQPVTAEEVAIITQLADQYKWPLIPRGSATSGFGGAVPVRGGIVLDFVRMKNLISLDEENLTVTVEPGMVWGDLQDLLKAKGYGLRLYPSSAPSATVAGWVAQGGSGFGSYEYGFCGDNITSIDLILPDGSTQTFSGDKLKLVYSLCGITGMISKVTLNIKKYEQEIPVLLAFNNLVDATAALKAIKNQDMPLWSVSMTTPDYIKLKQAVSHHIILAEDKYYITLVFMDEINNALNYKLKQVVTSYNGQIISEVQAQEEWDDRFLPMRFKKLGPTLIASEVIVPVDKLAEFVTEVEKRFKGHFALEGTMINHDKIAVLGFMLADERKSGFPMAYTSSLTVMEVGEKLGGRIPSLGLYFAEKAREVLGEDLINEIWSFKKQIDPNSTLNPGKVMPGSVDKNSLKILKTAMSLANTGKGLISMVGKVVDKVQGDKFYSPLDEEITHDAFSCALCGYCRNVCTVFDSSPWESISPRGKYYLLSQYIKGNVQMDEEVGRALYSCTTCKKCDEVCQIKAHNAHNWMSLRPCFHANGMENIGLSQIRKNVLATGNFWGVPAADKFNWLDVPTKKQGKIGFWAGCWANVVMPNMPQNVTRILDKAGVEFVHFGEGESCCGLYLALGGYENDFIKQAQKNLQVFKDAGIEKVILTCPGCYATFSENYVELAKKMGMEIKFQHIVSFLSELIGQGQLKFPNTLDCKITYHDSCHVGRWFGHYEEPRNIINAVPGVELIEMSHNRENGLCCGLVAAFDSLPTVGHSGIKRVSEAEATGADYLITNCAGCGSQFNATTCAMQTNIKQKDLSELVAQALGMTVQDPTENVATFMGAVGQILADSKLVKTSKLNEKENVD